MSYKVVKHGTVAIKFYPKKDIDPEEYDFLGGAEGMVMSRSFEGRWAMLWGFLNLWWTARRLW